MNFQCPVATISTSSSSTSGTTYAYPYTGAALPKQSSLGSSGPGTGICDTNDISSDLPSETRQQALVSLHQAINDRLVLSVDTVYASRQGASRNARGGISNAAAFNPAVGAAGDTAFGAAGSTAARDHTNPFYVGVPGASATATSEFVTMAFDDLLAGFPQASTKTGQTTAFATAGLDYDLGGDWLLSLGGTAGTDFSFSRSSGSPELPRRLIWRSTAPPTLQAMPQLRRAPASMPIRMVSTPSWRCHAP